MITSSDFIIAVINKVDYQVQKRGNCINFRYVIKRVTII